MRVAVTGASGAIGGHAVRLLASDPANHVTAIRRRAQPGAADPGNVSTALADYMDPGALRAALDGVERLVFVSSDGPVAQVVVHHDNVIRAAAEAGVSHVVALSGLDADADSPFCYAVSYSYTERLLRDSGCPFSIARASVYSEFFLAVLAQACARDQLRVPAGEGRVSLVSRQDVARSLVALVQAPPSGGHHDVTGPEALDLPALATHLAHHWSTPIEYAAISPEEYRAELERGGESAWWTYAYETFFESIREQRWAAVSDTVQRLTGQAPTPLPGVLGEIAPSRPPPVP
jgi:NAD(P)H dehydrogenase (quinone)